MCVLCILGREVQGNDPGVSVDYGTSDPIVRWDSYENFNLHHEDSVEGMCTQNLCHVKLQELELQSN